MIRENKEDFVKAMGERLAANAGLVFVDFTGMNAAQQTSFRVKLREAEVGYQVVKNTLMLRALEQAGITDAKTVLKGTPTGVIFGKDDPIAAAKLAVEFKKDCDKLNIKGGLLEGKSLDAQSAVALSKMPGRQEMLAEILGLIMSPGRNLQSLLKGPGSRLASQIATKADDGEEG